MRSIRRYLRRVLLITVTLITSLAALWSYHDTRDQINELFDAELAQTTRTMVALYFEYRGEQGRDPQEMIHDLQLQPVMLPDSLTDEPTPLGHPYEKKLGFQIWDDDGHALLGMRTPGVLETMIPAPGYAHTEGEGHDWRTFTLYDEVHGVWASAAQRDDVRDELTWQIALRNLMPPVIGVLLIALLIPFVIARGFSPLLRISRQITARRPSYLEPIDGSEAPDEIRGMVDALNGLFGRLAETLEKERRFTANAAHELRTPLAAIKVHAQNLMTDTTEARSQRGARSIINGVDRMTRVVEQLLTLSRLESGEGMNRQTVDLTRLGRELQRDMQPLIERRGIRFTQEIPDALQIRSYENGLYVLLRNLLDNALRYTPEGGEVCLRMRQAEDRLHIEIADSGPGIPVAERERVFERFVRLAGQRTSGSGLGLSIVQELAERLGGEIRLDETSLPVASGLSVHVTLPIE
ncbi:ATP-binding protein [Salinicola sp. LHM]|uniref:ATP-binding protein n=1 Tax=Salinicola sp. LHM TaxID=3065298 RepID=UPI002ACE779A|nr:ATP-binding protein [Salinicola sp. LHM]MEC8919156.1 ATP-binding protein [Pseudomonadota bacterium]MED5500190.1 ATP-binding protein [Pseudomonadota bacterium]WQH32040.1 ATP-binding protein [Salinicola sp. LHM]